METPKETKFNKQIFLKKLNLAEKNFSKAEMKVSELSNSLQPFFDEEIVICMSTDGAVITTDKGEIGFVRDFIKNTETDEKN